MSCSSASFRVCSSMNIGNVTAAGALLTAPLLRDGDSASADVEQVNAKWRESNAPAAAEVAAPGPAEAPAGAARRKSAVQFGDAMEA